MAVVVVVADADALSPAFAGEAGLRPDLGEPAVTVVVIELRKRLRAGATVEGRSVGDKNIFGAVAVVVENGDAVPRGLDDIVLTRFATRRIRNGEPAGLR